MGPNSYARGGQGNSYGYSMGRTYDSGNSYMYHPGYDPMSMYSMPGGNSYAMGYSRHGDKQSMIMELQEMMNETQDMKVKEAIQKTLDEIK